MKTNKEIYEELSKQYSDEELVESVYISEDLSPEEQKKVDEEFRKIRLERLKNMTPRDILLSNLLQMKYRMEDYFRQPAFMSVFSFANQLRYYIKISKRSNKEIASNLDIHPTKLSRILNGKENPNVELMYRLEEHSEGELPAYYWWRLFSRELENEIKTDLNAKLTEAQKVKHGLEIRD